jgi:hypothetical protein
MRNAAVAEGRDAPARMAELAGVAPAGAAALARSVVEALEETDA